jgi:hypothetical protein
MLAAVDIDALCVKCLLAPAPGPIPVAPTLAVAAAVSMLSAFNTGAAVDIALFAPPVAFATTLAIIARSVLPALDALAGVDVAFLSLPTKIALATPLVARSVLAAVDAGAHILVTTISCRCCIVADTLTVGTEGARSAFDALARGGVAADGATECLIVHSSDVAKAIISKRHFLIIDALITSPWHADPVPPSIRRHIHEVGQICNLLRWVQRHDLNAIALTGDPTIPRHVKFVHTVGVVTVSTISRKLLKAIPVNLGWILVKLE